jgi:prolyl-tRNA editing enzyme YbaK/EbsC (Cys-tRNA(Pro) deacylase)
MPKGPERFRIAARALGLEPELRRFPEGTKTAQQAAEAVGCELGQIVKSLVFVGDEGAFLALTSGPNRADPTRLAPLLGGGEVRRANAEEAREATGYGIGGTPPFGHPARLRTFCDPDLLVYQELWAAGGAPDVVFPIAAETLLRLTGAIVADFKEAVGEPRV